MQKPYVIAETACSHDGSVERLKFLIKSAVESGCNAVQVQVWKHLNIVTPDHPDIDILRRIELSESEWEECFDYACGISENLELIACVYDEESLFLCDKLGAKAFKIHTSDLGNFDLLDAAAKTGKRIDLSIGASTFSEIQSALDCIDNRCEVWLMYGYQLFPTPTAGLNLRIMNTLSHTFGKPVGYQDHSQPDVTSAYTIPIAAIGSGINIIEKHLTDDRSRKGADAEAALEPSEMKNFVELCHEAKVALGNGRHRSFTEEEKKYRKYSKKSLVAAYDMKAGEVICREHVLIRRAPELGLPADAIEFLIGKKLSRDIGRFSLIKEEDIC